MQKWITGIVMCLEPGLIQSASPPADTDAPGVGEGGAGGAVADPSETSYLKSLEMMPSPYSRPTALAHYRAIYLLAHRTFCTSRVGSGRLWGVLLAFLP